MNNLIRAELLKLRTTRTFWWSVVAALAFVPVSIALAIAKIGTPSGTSLASAEGFRNVIAAASSGGVLVLLIGIVIMAGEFRFNTVTSTFLITPDRKRVVGAKLAASSLVVLAPQAPGAEMETSRGCPWRCEFCASNVMLGRKYRKRPDQHLPASGIAHQLQRSGGLLGRPAVGSLVVRLGREVEQQRSELDRSHPVDHAVVHLPDDPEPAVRQPVGHAQLP